MTENLIAQTYSGETGRRLDQVLHEMLQSLEDFPGVTRSNVKRWIEAGFVCLDGASVTKAGQVVKPGQSVVLLPGIELSGGIQEVLPWEHELQIVFEDADLIVVDKPAGLTVHPGAGNHNQTLLNALVRHLGPEAGWLSRAPEHYGALRPGIVHRIDKDTSGLLVIAKHEAAHKILTAQFARRTVGRAYYALALSGPRGKSVLAQEDSGEIDAPIGRNPAQRTEMAVLREGGKRALTKWKVLSRMPWAVLLEARLQTGRTHQIRVHLKHIASPIIGDRVYGDFSALPAELRKTADAFGRQALHAFLLEIDHPADGRRLSFKSALPSDMRELLRGFGAEVSDAF